MDYLRYQNKSQVINIAIQIQQESIKFIKINMISQSLRIKFWCSSLRTVKQIPFLHRNLSQLQSTLAIPPNKQALQQQIKQHLGIICENTSQANKVFKQAESRVKNLYQFIKTNILQESDPQLNSQFFQKAHYYFQKEGKKIRPIMVEMMANNYMVLLKKDPAFVEQFNEKIFLWSSLIQMMHIASLAHDDVVDDSPSRRGQESQHIRYGSRTAIFSGNYIISRASKAVSQFNSPRLYQIYANTMQSLADGQIKQLISKSRYNFANSQPKKKNGFDLMLQRYMQKTYYKSAALMSNSLLGVPTILYQMIGKNHLQKSLGLSFQEIQDKTFEIGQHYGLALQLVDDILDYISTAQEMGKEEMSDLIQGNVTAPVFFTFYHYDQQIPQHGDQISISMLNKKRKNKQEAMRVKQWVEKGVGIELTYLMAAKHIEVALKTMQDLGIKGDETLGWRYLGYKLLTRRK